MFREALQSKFYLPISLPVLVFPYLVLFNYFECLLLLGKNKKTTREGKGRNGTSMYIYNV